MRQLVATLIQLAGLVSVVVGGFLVYVPLGFVLAGAALVVVGVAAERD